MAAIFDNATLVPVGELHSYHRNPRKGDVDAIAASLEASGQFKPVIVNRGTLTGRPNEVLAGNHTLQAAKKLQWAEVAVVWLDLDDDAARRVVLSDNRTSDLGTYDDDLLLSLLKEMSDLTGTGYDGDDLLQMMGDQFEEPAYKTDPDEAPELPQEPRSKRGDVYRLGDHLVACGDSTDAATYELLLGEELADILWSDPPYGVDYVGKTKDALTIQNDGKVGLAGLLHDAFTAAVAVMRGGAPVYVAHADSERITFEQAMTEAGFRVRQNLIWAKNTIVLGRSDYHYKHEPILYGFAPGGEGRLGRGGERWHGDNAQSTVFNVDKPAANRLHPTMKPVELIVAMLRNSAARGAIVLDPFGGSGSTLVAADKLGMRARLIELDPRYVDVILDRYTNLTGIEPTLVAHD